MELKVIAFDLFGTVFDLAGVPREEIVAYIDHISKTEWSPLKLQSSWQHLPTFPDSREGIERLRTKYRVVTCSNAPLRFTSYLLENAQLRFDAITPLEVVQCFKPNANAYWLVPFMYCVDPKDVLVVTGNEKLGRNPKGDHQYAAELGMNGQLIRNPGCPQTIIELAEQLGC